MLKKMRKTFVITALFGAVFFLNCAQKSQLQLIDEKSGQICAVFELAKDKRFSILFTHSVNQSLVEEGYIIKNGVIFLDWCKYSSFGAGVATELEKKQTLTFLPDGNMLISGFDRKIPHLTYRISTVYDHFLKVNGHLINLTEIGLKDKQILVKSQ